MEPHSECIVGFRGNPRERPVKVNRSIQYHMIINQPAWVDKRRKTHPFLRSPIPPNTL